MWHLSSLTRDWTHVLCVARWVLNYWIPVEVPMCKFLCDLFSVLSTSGNAGSYGNSVYSFEELPTCFPKVSKNTFFFFLQSHQHFMGIPVSPHPQQHLLLSVFLILAILVDVNRYLLVVLICITLVIDHIECFFMCFLTICMSSLEKWQFKSSAHWHFF